MTTSHQGSGEVSAIRARQEEPIPRCKGNRYAPRIRIHGFAAVQQGNVQDQRVPLPPLEGNPIAHSFPFGSSGLFGRELPEPWLDESRILWKCRRIFVGYRLFGDDS